MSTLIEQSDIFLIGIATEAFNLGLVHGRTRPTPMQSEQLMKCLSIPMQMTWRIIDKNKLRQVYGAGYDMMHIQHYKDEAATDKRK